MNRKHRNAVQAVVAKFPGALFEVWNGKRHDKVALHHKGDKRLVVMSRTPSCPHAVANALADVRRALKELDHG